MHLFCFVFDIKLCPSTLFLQKQSPARVIPRIIPDTYPESYPNLALLCHGPVGPFRKQPQSPAWCRREPFDIGYSVYVDSKEGGANHTPNHTSETYLETYLRIIPRMQHALLTTEFSYTATCWTANQRNIIGSIRPERSGCFILFGPLTFTRIS